jgi:hypothetical protein
MALFDESLLRVWCSRTGLLPLVVGQNVSLKAKKSGGPHLLAFWFGIYYFSMAHPFFEPYQ